ncbi:V-type proton ATPase subunit C [Folsomia candida]|uniref:V-type proton ATPase subunit C n=1 Tax=Folsomia candida TaxID=158441 RepID=A0A226DUE4_FOLCA|nr:V-type proton ATPase subunit C [Folsomia candida]
MDVDLVWANLKTEIEAAYAITETQENIALRLKEVTYQKCGSALSYVYAVLSLLQRMDAGMTVEKRIKYLLKGLPPDLAVKVYDQRPKTDMEVKDILLHHEKFLAMYPQKSNQLQKDVAGSNWPELENTLKNLQLQSENTYMAKSNPTDFSPNRNAGVVIHQTEMVKTHHQTQMVTKIPQIHTTHNWLSMHTQLLMNLRREEKELVGNIAMNKAGQYAGDVAKMVTIN